MTERQRFDDTFETLFLEACKRPGMFVLADLPEQEIPMLCAFFDGYDLARSGGPLMGLKEWLVMRGSVGDNQHWVAVCFALEQQRKENPMLQPGEMLGALLEAFFNERREGGVTRIFHDYAKWLLRRRSYEGPLRKKNTERRAGRSEPGGHLRAKKLGG